MNLSSEHSQKSSVIGICVFEEAPAYTTKPPPPYTARDTSSHLGHNQQLTKHQHQFSTCPACQQDVLTRVEHFNTRKTHLAAGFLFGFTLWCMCCCLAAIPYFSTSLKKTSHFCPITDFIKNK